MSSLLPVAVYGLKVPAGDVMIPALTDFPATFRITMAAIDPSAIPEHTGTANGNTPARATLKIIYAPSGFSDDEDSEEDSDEEDYLKALLAGAGPDSDTNEESLSEEEEANGGPSDPLKTKKARKQAALEQAIKGLAEKDSDDEMEVDGSSPLVSAAKKGKGKAISKKTIDDEDGIEEEDDEDESPEETEELVLCTLDPLKAYQQPLDLTIGEDQRVFFKVSGTHAIYLTGNYVIPAEAGHSHSHQQDIYDREDDEEDYDLSPDEEELDEDESDELDDIEDPRITELASEEEEVPKLIQNEAPVKKGKNKRAADDSEHEPASLDDLIAKSIKPAEPTTNGEPKLSKKQLKKLKNNAGKAVEVAVENKSGKKEEPTTKDSPSGKGDKKVQFAKNLEQGPSSVVRDIKLEGKADPKADPKADTKADTKKEGEKAKASLGLKTVQGVKIDDRKLGKGPAAKKGDQVGMRYIGKLQDGKVFDANKSGKALTFTIGNGDVIKGWDIGIAGMSTGGERRIIVPAKLAYGGKAMPGIPANSELTFDVKLLEIK